MYFFSYQNNPSGQKSAVCLLKIELQGMIINEKFSELKESSQVKPDEKHFEATDEQLKEWSNNMETYLDMQKERMKKRRCTIT